MLKSFQAENFPMTHQLYTLQLGFDKSLWNFQFGIFQRASSDMLISIQKELWSEFSFFDLQKLKAHTYKHDKFLKNCLLDLLS